MIYFLTGSTGFVGSYLLKILLENNHKVYALVRKSREISSRKKIIKILNFWDKGTLRNKYKNFIALEGDIVKNGLGLNKNAARDICRQVDQIFHCAAATKFNGSLKELKEVNVNGSRNVFDLGLKFMKKGKLKKINYLSSVYVCGDHGGVFKESDLEVNQTFLSPYQASKFEAERIANQYRKDGVWIDVFRSPAVAGELNTGKTPFFNQALYQALHLLNLGLFEFLPIEKEQKFHMVSVDELCRSILMVSSKRVKRNRNYHNFNNLGIPLRNTISLFSKYLGVKKVKFLSNENFIMDKLTPIQKKIIQFNFLFLNNEVKLDSMETNRLLNRHGFYFSALNNDMLITLLNYSIERGFLKKK